MADRDEEALSLIFEVENLVDELEGIEEDYERAQEEGFDEVAVRDLITRYQLLGQEVDRVRDAFHLYISTRMADVINNVHVWARRN